MATEQFYANPYSWDHTGFYFSTLEEYEAGRDKLNAAGCEEWELEYIDGDNAELFKTCSVSQLYPCIPDVRFKTLYDRVGSVSVL